MEEYTTELLIGAITALSTVVGVLYKQTHEHFEAVSEKLAACERDRADLWAALADVKRRIDDGNENTD